jgi:hypothetical protein
MGNEGASVGGGEVRAVEDLELGHLGPVKLMEQDSQYCLLKTFSYCDQFLMEDCFRRLKARSSRPSSSTLNVLHVAKRELKEICANSYQLLVLLERPQQSLQQLLDSRLAAKRNFSEEELLLFLGRTVDSLIHLQDNGLKNIHLDGHSLLLCGDHLKVLDAALALSSSYHSLLVALEKGEAPQQALYLAPELLAVKNAPLSNWRASTTSPTSRQRPTPSAWGCC